MAVDIIRATGDPVVLGIVRAREVTEEQTAKDAKEVPKSRGNCGNCGHEVWTTQPRYGQREVVVVALQFRVVDSIVKLCG